MSWFNISQPVTSVTNCIGSLTSGVSNALSSLTSKSPLEHGSELIAKTIQVARSIPDNVTYFREGAKYVSSMKNLVPGLSLAASGISLAFFTHKTKIDSKYQKFAMYLLAAAVTFSGIFQIVDYLNITSCVGKEIEEKTARVDDPKTPYVEGSFRVIYVKAAGKPQYNGVYNAITEDGIHLASDFAESSRCF